MHINTLDDIVRLLDTNNGDLSVLQTTLHPSLSESNPSFEA